MSIPVEDARRRAAAWRAVVSTTMRSLGISDAEAAPPSRRRSDDFLPRADVRTPSLGVFIKAAPISWSAVSTYMNKATLDADDEGLGRFPVVIKPAHAGPPESAYCILRLSDFAPLAKDAESWRSRATDGDLSDSEGTA